MLGLVFALLLEAAPAAPPPATVQPDWLQRPSGSDMERVYPEAALQAHADGRSTIRCTVSADGMLTNCRVVAEDPPGLGFGEAGLQLSTLFKIRPKSRDGQSVDGATVTIPIRFLMPDSSAFKAPDWDRRPLGEDFARVYPDAAQRKGLTGRAVIKCEVLVSGSLTGCEVTQESPPGEGFGEAALKLAGHFHMKPMTIDGRPRDARITIPTVFLLPGGPVEPYTAALRCFGRTAAEAGRNPASKNAREAASAWAGRALAEGAKTSIPADDTKQFLRQSHEKAAAGKAPDQPTLDDCLSAFRTARAKAKH